MPFKSEKQRRYLWAKHPEVAREFVADERGIPWHKRKFFKDTGIPWHKRGLKKNG